MNLREVVAFTCARRGGNMALRVGAKLEGIMLKVVQWVGGFVFLVAAAGGALSDPLVALPMGLLGLSLLPPLRDVLREKAGKPWAPMAVSLVLFLGIIAFVMPASIAREKKQLQAEFDESGPAILASIDQSIEAGQAEAAREAIEKFEPLALEDMKERVAALAALDAKIKAEEEAAAAAKLEAENAEKIAALLEEVQAIPASDLYANRSGYEGLLALAPANTEFKAKFDHYDGLIRKKEGAAAAEKAKRDAFYDTYGISQGSGRLFWLEEELKVRLNDPKSYKHVATKIYKTNDGISVTIQYRAKNGFGGLILTQTEFKVWPGRRFQILSD